MILQLEDARAWLQEAGAGNRPEASLARFTEISDEGAALLGRADAFLAHQDPATLDLSGLKSLSPRAAEALGQFRGRLKLDGLESISVDLACRLGNVRALSLAGITSVDLETARELGQVQDWLRIGLTTATREVLWALGRSYAELEWPNLQTLPDEQLERWVREAHSDPVKSWEVRHLRLPLRKLTLAQAKLLEGFGGTYLALDAVEELEEVEIARSLARLTCDVSLAGLHHFSDSVASELSQGRYRQIYLSGRLRLSLQGFINLDSGRSLLGKLSFRRPVDLPLEAQAILRTKEFLNEHQALELSALRPAQFGRERITSVRMITPKAAAIVSRIAGLADLDLGGVDRLPDAVAAELSAYQGNLTLGGDRLSVFAAQCLAKRPYRRNTRWSLNLAVTALAPAVAAALAPTRYQIRFGGIRELSPEAATALSAHRAGMDFPGLRSLSKEVAALGLQPGVHIDLRHIRKIDDQTAEILSRWDADDHFYRSLELHEVAELSETALGFLAAFPGKLFLGVHHLTDRGAALLAGHSGPELYLTQLSDLSDEAARSLARHQGEVHLKEGSRAAEQLAQARANASPETPERT